MAYNYNPTPQYYPPVQQTGSPYYQQPVMNQQKIICEYVQGENAAKSYPVAPGQFAVLLDIENPVIYTKTTDNLGRPQPIKILDYKERVEAPQLQNTQNNYVTKDDLDNFKNEMKDLIKQFSRPVNNYKKNREES